MSVPTVARVTELDVGVWLIDETFGEPVPPFASKLTVKIRGVYLITTVPAPPTPPPVLLVVPFTRVVPVTVGSHAEPAPPPPPVPFTPLPPAEAPARYVVLSPA